MLSRRLEKGVLYIVSGSKQIVQECEHSARTLKKFEPTIPVQVVTTTETRFSSTRDFDFIDRIDENIHPLKAKVRYLTTSRFEQTLFLDADTEVRRPLTDLFIQARDSDFAAVYDNLCDWTQSIPVFLGQESQDINTGLLLYRLSEPVKKYLNIWSDVMQQQDERDMRPGHNCDQVHFNLTLRDKMMTDSSLRFTILPNTIYNVRPWCWNNLKTQGTYTNIAVAHAHHLHHSLLDKVLRKISSSLS